MIAPGLSYAGTVPDLAGGLRWAMPAAEVVSVSAAAGHRSVAALPVPIVEQCPVVRGRTVWDASQARAALVESPNAYGCIEPAPPVASVLVTTAGSPPPAWSPVAALVKERDRWHRFGGDRRPERKAPDFSRLRGRFEKLTDAADRLARRLAQARGVHLAFGRPEAPVFVVIVPAHPERWAVAVSAVAGLTADSPPIPGLPGSVRIKVHGDLSSRGIAAVAPRVEALERDERETSR